MNDFVMEPNFLTVPLSRFLNQSLYLSIHPYEKISYLYHEINYETDYLSILLGMHGKIEKIGFPYSNDPIIPDDFMKIRLNCYSASNRQHANTKILFVFRSDPKTINHKKGLYIVSINQDNHYETA